MLFPLKSWETFQIVIPAAHNAFGADLHKGVAHGKPGEMPADIKERAREAGMTGLFPDAEINIEWIDR